MVMSLRRVLLRAQALPFRPSSTLLQLHTSVRKARFALNSLGSPSFARFSSADHINQDPSEERSDTQEQDEVAKRVKKRATRISRNAASNYRRATDPEYLRKRRENQRVLNAKHPGNNDPASNQKKIARQRQREQNDPAFVLRRRIPDWIKRLSWVVDRLPWKTHIPIYYPEKVKHQCEKCFVTRYGGAKLWWKKRTAPGQSVHESYRCQNCYVTGREKLPEGYEDIPELSIAALRARKIELDGPDSIPKRAQRISRGLKRHGAS